MKKRVLAFGTFDLLHAGHLHYLHSAKKLGSELVVVIARDETAGKLKGGKPINDEKTRQAIVGSLRFVDKAVLGLNYFRDKFEIVRKLKPDVIAVGYDQVRAFNEFKKLVKEHGLKAKVVKIPAFNSKKFKSSKLKRKLLEKI